MQLNEALDIALSVWNMIKPHCDICKIAGSIRREKPEVKDIEIVCLPKMIMGKDLFGQDTVKVRSQEFVNLVTTLGVIQKGKSDGRYMQIDLVEPKVNLDLFMPEDYDFWRQYAIRTGSADWAARFIAGGWIRQGWCGSDVGLRLQSECVGKTGPDGKKHWKCVTAKSEQTLPPHWKSEQEFFDWIKLPWVEPKRRNI